MATSTGQVGVSGRQGGAEEPLVEIGSMPQKLDTAAGAAFDRYQYEFGWRNGGTLRRFVVERDSDKWAVVILNAQGVPWEHLLDSLFFSQDAQRPGQFILTTKEHFRLTLGVHHSGGLGFGLTFSTNDDDTSFVSLDLSALVQGIDRNFENRPRVVVDGERRVYFFESNAATLTIVADQRLRFPLRALSLRKVDGQGDFAVEREYWPYAAAYDSRYEGQFPSASAHGQCR